MVNRAQLAAIFDVSPNVLTKWTNERGMPVAHIGGGRANLSRYDLVAVFRWWRVEFDAGKHGAARDRYYEQMTAKVSLQNALARGEVHDLATCSEFIGRHIDAAKAAFVGLAAWSEQVGILAPEAYEVLDRRIWEILDELSGGVASRLEREWGKARTPAAELAGRLKRKGTHGQKQDTGRNRSTDVGALGATGEGAAAE